MQQTCKETLSGARVGDNGGIVWGRGGTDGETIAGKTKPTLATDCR